MADENTQREYHVILFTTSTPPFKFSIHTNTLPTCFARRHALVVLRVPLEAKQGCCHLSQMELCNASIIHQSLFSACFVRNSWLNHYTPSDTPSRIRCNARTHTRAPRSRRPADSAAIVSARLVSCSLNSVCRADGSLLSGK